MGIPRHMAWHGTREIPPEAMRSPTTSSQTSQRSTEGEIRGMGIRTEPRRKSFITRDRSSRALRVAHRITTGLNSARMEIIVV